MRIAVTGGTGFVGRHLARALVEAGHEIVLLARGVDQRDLSMRALSGARFAAAGVSDEKALAEAFAGCAAVAHCAGINREIGEQTYARVHVQRTRNVVESARTAGVGKVALMSFLRARPACGSGYHQSKWAAEEIVRGCGLDYTVIKAGMTYGRGDHMLDHLSHALHTLPVFASVGFREAPVRPLAVEDLVRVLVAALAEGRLPRKTVAALGPEEMTLSEAVRRVAQALRRGVLVLPAPAWTHRLLAVGFEATMTVPLVARAQLRMLQEGMSEPAPPCEELPEDLRPRLRFTVEQVRKGLPPPGPFGVRDLRLFRR